jgi:hypothetical protein
MIAARRRIGSLVAVLAGLALFATPDALADTTTSSNWSGYAAHRTGVSLRQVIGQWRVP